MQKKHSRPPGRPRIQDIDKPTEATILEVAAKLFIELGYEGVSVETVAEHSDVTKATVYYHYANKGALFTAAMTRFLARIRERTEQILHGSGSLRERMVAVAEARIAVPSPLVDFDALLRESEMTLTRGQVSEIKEAEEAIVRTIASEFAKSAETGEIQPTNSELVAHAYLALLRLGKTRTAEDSDLFRTPREAAESLVRLLWDGIGSSHA